MKGYLALAAGTLLLVGTIDSDSSMVDVGRALLRSASESGRSLSARWSGARALRFARENPTVMRDMVAAPHKGVDLLSLKGQLGKHQSEERQGILQPQIGLEPVRSLDHHPLVAAFEELGNDLVGRLESAVSLGAGNAESSLSALIHAHPEAARLVLGGAALPALSLDSKGIAHAVVLADQSCAMFKALVTRVKAVAGKLALDASASTLVKAALAEGEQLVQEMCAMIADATTEAQSMNADLRRVRGLLLLAGDATAKLQSLSAISLFNANAQKNGAEDEDTVVGGLLEVGASARESDLGQDVVEMTSLLETAFPGQSFLSGVGQFFVQGTFAVVSGGAGRLIGLFSGLGALFGGGGAHVGGGGGGVVVVAPVVPPSAPPPCEDLTLDQARPRVTGVGGRFQFPATAVAVLANGILEPNATDVVRDSHLSFKQVCVRAGGFIPNYPVANGHAPLNTTNLQAWMDFATLLVDGSGGAPVNGQAVVGANALGIDIGHCAANMTQIQSELLHWRALAAGPIDNAALLNSAGDVHYFFPPSVMKPMRALAGIAWVQFFAGAPWATNLCTTVGVVPLQGHVANLKLAMQHALESLLLVHAIVSNGIILHLAEVPQIAVGYDLAAGNPRWTAKRLNRLVTTPHFGLARGDNAFLQQLQEQQYFIAPTSDMWHREDLGTGHLSAPVNWVVDNLLLGPVAPSRGHMIASSYATGTSFGMMSTMSTANAANQPSRINGNVWASLEDKVTTFVRTSTTNAEHVFIVVGTDGVNNGGRPPRLPVAWSSDGVRADAGSINPALFWTAIHRPENDTLGATMYDTGTQCGTVVFACYNKEHSPLVVPDVTTACMFTNVANLTMWTDVDPFPTLSGSERDCDGARFTNALTMFGFP